MPTVAIPIPPPPTAADVNEMVDCTRPDDALDRIAERLLEGVRLFRRLAALTRNVPVKLRARGEFVHLTAAELLTARLVDAGLAIPAESVC